MAAARANLLEVLTPAAYEHLERLGERMAGCDAVIARTAGATRRLGSKGCVSTRRAGGGLPSFKRRHDPELGAGLDSG